MDERLNHYMNEPGRFPPAIKEGEIVANLEQRRKKTSIILLALAGLLWALVFYGLAFRVGMANQMAGIALLFITSMGYICAGALAGIIFHIRKVGF